jgi:hypothetical protein
VYDDPYDDGEEETFESENKTEEVQVGNRRGSNVLIHVHIYSIDFWRETIADAFVIFSVVAIPLE